MLVSKIDNHVQQALGLLMTQYSQLPRQYLFRLNGTPAPVVDPGTYSPFVTVAPNSAIDFGYGALVGIAQAFHVASALDLGRVTAYFQANGTVADGFVAAYLYRDDTTSPATTAAPTGNPFMRAVEVYSAAEIAAEWVNQGSTGYVSKLFTFDFALAPGYYWIVFRSSFIATPGNSLRIGAHSSGGLALANGYRAGLDITGLFAAAGTSGTEQLALTIASKVSAPPLPESNVIEVSGVGALLAAIIDQGQILENAIFGVNEGRMLFDGSSYPAVGAQLDGLGELVVQPRNGMSDMLYLIFILGKIGENYTNATVPQLARLISLLYQTQSFGLLQLYPAEIDVQIPSSSGLDPAFYAAALTVLKGAVGGGVGVGFGTVYDPDPFVFGELGGPDPDGGGYGDTTDSTAGGDFADLFYNDPSV